MIKALKGQSNLDFMGRRKLAVGLSLALILLSLVSLATRGLDLGIDFTGGTLIEVGYPEAVDLAGVRGALETGGIEDATVQHFGTSHEVLVRMPPQPEAEARAQLSNEVLDTLQAHGPAGAEMRRVEFVGPAVGDELTNDGGLAVLYALIGILIYVAFRFEFRFAIGSVMALVHDVIITLGILSALQVKFDLSVVAALLAVIGYSLNDTIVVFDRIRENFRKLRKTDSEGIINVSLNHTLARTLMTSVTTLLVLLALFVLGGEVINAFALTLIIGVLVGTYSSIFVASSSALMLGVSKADLMPPEKEGAEAEQGP